MQSFVWEFEGRPSHSKDALLLGELARAQRPEVDVGFPAGDDVGAVVWVELHSEHSLICTLEDENAWKN